MPKRDAVRGVVGRPILEIEGDVLDQHLLLVGMAVAVGVDVSTEMRRVHQVEPVAIPDQSARRIDVRHEEAGFVGPAVAVDVAQPIDGAAVLFAIARAVLVARNIQHAVGSGRDINRIFHGRRDGEQRCLIALGSRELAEQLFLAFGTAAAAGTSTVSSPKMPTSRRLAH